MQTWSYKLLLNAAGVSILSLPAKFHQRRKRIGFIFSHNEVFMMDLGLCIRVIPNAKACLFVQQALYQQWDTSRLARCQRFVPRNLLLSAAFW